MPNKIFEYLRNSGFNIKSTEKNKDYHSIERYRKIPLHAIFLFTSEDDIIENYIKNNWGALDSLSGQFCDVHPSIEQFESNEDAYDFVDKLDLIIEPNHKIIENLPGIFFWDINGNGTFISLKDAKSNNDLKTRIRKIFSEIRKDPKIDAIRNIDKSKLKERFSVSWIVLSIGTALLSIGLYKFLQFKPKYIDETLIGVVVFMLILLANPIRRFYKAFWISITMLGSITLIPAFNLTSEINIENLNGVEKRLFNLIIEDQHWSLYLVLGSISIVSLILDYLERKKADNK